MASLLKHSLGVSSKDIPKLHQVFYLNIIGSSDFVVDMCHFYINYTHPYFEQFYPSILIENLKYVKHISLINKDGGKSQ